MYLVKKDIEELISKGELTISPLLDKEQIGDLTVDLRLGYNFLVTSLGRNAFIDATLLNEGSYSIKSSFQETRRMLGETFLLHPNQTILASSLEYVKLPNNVFAELSMRSSYLRLGISISAIVQPGYCGCFSIELTNVNHTSINLTVGVPIFQSRLFKLNEPLNYFSRKRKYICQVRPIASAANDDKDLKVLKEVWKANNKK